MSLPRDANSLTSKPLIVDFAAQQGQCRPALLPVRWAGHFGSMPATHWGNSVEKSPAGGHRRLAKERKSLELAVDLSRRGHAGVDPQAVAQLERLVGRKLVGRGEREGRPHPSVVTDV